MRTKRILLLPAGLLAALAPVAPAAPEDDEKSLWVAQAVELCARGELPSFEDETCTYPACAQGCTETCLEKTAAYREKLAANPTAYYAEVFAKKPYLWEAAAPIVERRFQEADTGVEVRSRLLDLVASVPAALDSELPVSLWNLAPDLFHAEHLIGFAATGRKEFLKALARRVEETNAADGPADIRPALFFALRGDARGKPTLGRAVKGADLSDGEVLPVLMAARGLEALGYEGAVARQRERVLEATVTALDEGDLALARRMAIQAEVFAASVKEGGKYGKKDKAGWAWRMAFECTSASCGTCGERAEELADAVAILAAIERVTPL